MEKKRKRMIKNGNINTDNGKFKIDEVNVRAISPTKMKIIKIDHDNRYFREIYIIYKKWLKESSYEINEKEFLNEYLNSFNEDTLPNIYALIINDTLIGMYELSAKDFIDEEKYTPYLSRVYVKEQYRGLGYGKELIEHLSKNEEGTDIWKSEIFGRSLDVIVQEGIQAKLSMMPDNVRFKLCQTLTKIINKGSSMMSIICI